MKELDSWFLHNRRQFPWRIDPTPYKVWISEVMLQQTRASVVIGYFEKWMSLFPSVKFLAAASLEMVIKAWEGLGYYSRARNLHRAAKQILERFGGEIPQTKAELETLPGLGPYTIGAILSFGFQKRAVAVDGNVTRVITRYFLIEENVSRVSVQRKMREAAEQFLDPDRPWISAEALIELGATICTPKPRCASCPLEKKCMGKNKADYLPIKKEKKKITHLKRIVIWLEADGKVLVKKGEKGKVMADLYEFPYFEIDRLWSAREMTDNIEKTFQVKSKIIEKFPIIQHTFTRYQVKLYPFRLLANWAVENKGYEWIDQKRLKELPFSSGHRRILVHQKGKP